MTSPCPTCGASTVTTSDGRRLDPRLSKLGRWLEDGTELTPDQQRDPHIRGRFPHHCTKTPAPTPVLEQLDLFA